jgi:hypothetical protein
VSRFHIELTRDESEWVDRIDFRLDLPPGVDRHAVYLSNSGPIISLLGSLGARGGIPARRLTLWTDPELQTGRVKGSHKDLYARNGCAGAEAYTHPNFIPFLRYFLYGADLPDAVMTQFEAQVGNPEWFSGSDIIDLSKKTRELVRRHNLKSNRRDLEFQKLALDLGLSNYHANSVREAAQEAARR